jgi:hypothetical protein
MIEKMVNRIRLSVSLYHLPLVITLTSHVSD